MNLIVIQRFDHDGIRDIGEAIEMPQITGKELVNAGLCVAYDEKLYKKMQKQIKSDVLVDVPKPLGVDSIGGEAEQ
mgnify:CR=1 FL=1